MKKIFIIVLLFLSGCNVNRIDRIKSNFAAAGYTYSEDANQYIQDIFDENDTYFIPHVFTLKEGIITNVAIVLEFKSSKKLNETIEENNTLQGLLKDLKKSEYVNGNCLLIPLIPISESVEEMIDIFRN